MLHFLKKSSKSSCDGPVSCDTSLHDAERMCLAGDNSATREATKSRLSKNLSEILADQTCLCFFVQFMEARRSLSLIKFWLEVNSFQFSAQPSDSSKVIAEEVTEHDKRSNCKEKEGESEKKSNSEEKSEFEGEKREAVKKKEGICNGYSSSEHKNPSDNCDIEGRPLTDDEKSEIIQDQAKRISKQRNEAKTKKRLSQFRTTIATDAIKLFERYLISKSSYWIDDIPATVHSKISLSLCDCEENTFVSPYLFSEAQAFVFERLEKEFLNPFLESEFYSKYCLEILTGSSLTLADILHSEAALFYFMEFMEQEQKRNYLDFWMCATNFRRQLNIHSLEAKIEAKSDAMVLYEKYFSLQASHSLNFSDVVRSTVEENICTADGGPLKSCFDLPVRIVELYLNRNYFEKFVKSELFYKYITELMGKIKEHTKVHRSKSFHANDRGKRSHKKSNSDCSLEMVPKGFISTQNTLLAMESPPAKQVRTAPNSDMQIDSRQIYNSDLLWRRHSTSLSFGRVNSLGRFERDFEMELQPGNSSDDKWTLAGGGTKLKKAVRRLVHLPEDKMQEELAWHVAEMIIKDITDVTLNGQIVPPKT